MSAITSLTDWGDLGTKSRGFINRWFETSVLPPPKRQIPVSRSEEKHFATLYSRSTIRHSKVVLLERDPTELIDILFTKPTDITGSMYY